MTKNIVGIKKEKGIGKKETEVGAFFI